MTITVVTVPDGRFWFTQGLEIDYGAQGDTAEEALEHFTKGLRMTIDLNLKKLGRINELGPLATHEWQDFTQTVGALPGTVEV